MKRPSNQGLQRQNHWLARVAAVLFWLLVWQAAAMALHQPLLLSSPLRVAERLFALLGERAFYAALGYSLRRIALGFFAGFLLGALLAMLAVKEAGIPLNREVRLILGCSEETSWDDMAYYKAHCDMPRTGFSPDASYPIINTEKGMLLVSLRSPYEKNGLVRSIRVGERHNVVPGEASAELNGGEELAAKALEAAKKLASRRMRL